MYYIMHNWSAATVKFLIQEIHSRSLSFAHVIVYQENHCLSAMGAERAKYIYWQWFHPSNNATKQTCNFPPTSMSTVKLVRWVLRHCTEVVLPSVILLTIAVPSDSQLPFPTLCRWIIFWYYKYPCSNTNKIIVLVHTVQRSSSRHTCIQVLHPPTKLHTLQRTIQPSNKWMFQNSN